ncbi:MAG: LVIVD repeat-containing protein [bacterium]
MKTIMIFLSCIVFLFIVLAVHAVESKNVEFVGATMGAARAVHVEGSYAYLCAGSFLAVLDISNPAKPVELGRVQLPDIAYDVEVVGSYAYVADGWGGLIVIDVTDPRSPVEVGFCDTPGKAL